MAKASLFTVDTTELRKAFEQAEDDVNKRLAQANLLAAQVVVQRALPKVPVRSGRLKASVKALGSKRRGEVKAGGKKVPYANTIHWGSRRRGIKARPFLHDAARESEARVRQVYERAIDDIVKDI